MTIQSWCSAIARDFVTRIKAHGEGGVASPQREQVCPVGQVGVGLLGNYGKHVNAVGLICGPFHAPIPPTATLLTAARCTDYFRLWRAFAVPDDDYKLTECISIMGIDAACAAKNGTPEFDFYIDNDLNPPRQQQRLICVQPAADLSLGQQAEVIGRGDLGR